MKSKVRMAGILAFVLFLMPITAFASGFGGGEYGNKVIGPTDDGASTSIGQGSVFTGPVTGTFGSGGSSSGSSSSNSGSSSGSGGSGSTTPPLGQGYFTPPSDEEIAKSIADLIVSGDVIDDPSLTETGYKVLDPNGNETYTEWTSTFSSGSLTKRGYTALYWDWKFTNKNTGTVVPREKMPPNEKFQQTFSEAGHWYAYYREYGKWEEGYYTYRTVKGKTIINGEEYEWEREVKRWNHVAWKEGYKFNYRLLVDFFITTDMIGKPVDIPPQQRQIPVETKQTVAK